MSKDASVVCWSEIMPEPQECPAQLTPYALGGWGLPLKQPCCCSSPGVGRGSPPSAEDSNHNVCSLGKEPCSPGCVLKRWSHQGKKQNACPVSRVKQASKTCAWLPRKGKGNEVDLRRVRHPSS